MIHLKEPTMILTVTMNPRSIPRIISTTLSIDDVNRVVPKKTAGGEIACRVLCQLGDDDLSRPALWAATRSAYMGELMNSSISVICPIAGETRICLNILHEGNQTELLERAAGFRNTGSPPSRRFIKGLSKMINHHFGGLPKRCSHDYYVEAIKLECLTRRAFPSCWIPPGASLNAALESECHPTLVKPNLTEINAEEPAIPRPGFRAGSRPFQADERFQGILGRRFPPQAAKGLLRLQQLARSTAPSPPIPAVNATGSGDSTIAGFAHAIAAGARRHRSADPGVELTRRYPVLRTVAASAPC